MGRHVCLCRTVWVVACGVLALTGCARENGPRVFQTERSVTRGVAVTLATLHPSIGNSPIVDIEIDREGFLYVACGGPARVLRLSPEGDVHWVADGSETRDGEWQTSDLRLAVQGRDLLVTDRARHRIYRFDSGGSLLDEQRLQEVFAAASSPNGLVYVFPDPAGYMLDVFDGNLDFVRSLLPFPGGREDYRKTSCLLRSDGAGVVTLWNPDRSIRFLDARYGAGTAFTVDPPDLLENLRARERWFRRVTASYDSPSGIDPFLALIDDARGRFAALYLFASFTEDDKIAAYDGALYRFTREGAAYDVIRGLGYVTDAAFVSDDELVVIDPAANAIVRYRIDAL